MSALARLARSQRLAGCTCAGARFASTRATALPGPVLDLNPILRDPQATKQNLLDRKFPLDPSTIDSLVKLKERSNAVRRELQAVQERRNAVSKPQSGSTCTADEKKVEAKAIKAEMKRLEPELARLEAELQAIAVNLPNSSHPDAPIGDECQAIEVATFGPPIPSPTPAADPKRDHISTTSPEALGWTDLPSAALVSGNSWPILLKEGALLELALTNYALSVALSRGFTPVLPPDVVRSEVAERCGFRPRDGDAQQTYFLGDGTPTSDANLCLAGTAEVPLVAMSAASVFKQAELPRKHVALGHAFRAEAGARGADSRGLYRVHQFSKVEMVVVCTSEESNVMLEELRSIQEEILGALGLSLRVLDMPTQELGASAHRKYDIEAWMPGRGKWGELSSASNCTDYQSRRLGIRYRPEGAGAKATYAHTLNATAAAIPRLIVALLENGVVLGEKGEPVRVRLPAVLRRFWLGPEQEGGVIEWVDGPLRVEDA